MVSKTFFKFTTVALAFTTATLLGTVLNRAEGDKSKLKYYRTELKNNLSPAEFDMVENRCKRFCRTLGAKADAYEAAMQMYDCKASYNKGMIKGRENATNLLTDSLNKEAAKTIYKSYKKGLIDGAEKYRKSLNLMVTDTIKTVTPDSITTALRDSVKMAVKLK